MASNTTAAGTDSVAVGEGKGFAAGVDRQAEIALGIDPDLQNVGASGSGSRGTPSYFTRLRQRMDLRFFPAMFLSIPYGISSQAILFRSIYKLGFPWVTGFLEFTIVPQYFWWVITVIAGIVINLVFLVKTVKYPGIVHQEMIHPARVNFFYGPLLFVLHMALAHPENLSKNALSFWFFFCFFYQLLFSIYLVGRWLFGKNRHLGQAKIIYLMSVVGFLANAGLGTRIDMAYYHWSLFSFWVGLMLYFLVVITLFQNLHKTTLEERNNPVVFLFIGAPATAATAWYSISGGQFTLFCEVLWVLSSFFYMLVIRIASSFVLSNKFGLTWWAYCFPMAAYAQATQQFTYFSSNNAFMRLVSLVVSLMSMAVVLIVATRTLIESWRGTIYVDPIATAFISGGGKSDEVPDTLPELRVLRNKYTGIAQKAVNKFQAVADKVADKVQSSVRSLRLNSLTQTPQRRQPTLAQLQMEILGRTEGTPNARAHTIGARPSPPNPLEAMTLSEFAAGQGHESTPKRSTSDGSIISN